MNNLSTFLKTCPTHIKNSFISMNFNTFDKILLQNEKSNYVYILKIAMTFILYIYKSFFFNKSKYFWIKWKMWGKIKGIMKTAVARKLPQIQGQVRLHRNFKIRWDYK